MPEFEEMPMDESPFTHDHFHSENLQGMSLTRNEALFLDDSFTLMIEQEIEEQRIKAMRPVQMTSALAVPMELVEKVGKAVVFTTDPNNLEQDYETAFDISELLMIREVASSYIKIGDEPVGYNLKRKVCSILYGDEVERDERNKLTATLLDGIDLDLNNPKVKNIEHHRQSES